MHTTLFSRELRLLLCPNCGAPIEGAIGGGALSCRFCNAAVMLAPRDERRDLAEASAQPAVSEAERIERLRLQDHLPLVPPASLQYLVENGALQDDGVPLAYAELQRARQEVVGGAGFESTERLYFLTLMLYHPLSKQHKDAEVRALLETARDLLTHPRQRQVLHGMLARNAARVGDAAAAEGWLGLCNPHATNLEMDTAYRFSRAYLSTRGGDFQTVLRVLGSRIDEVPIADGQDAICAMLRANALERTGQVQVAAQQLRAAASFHPAGASFLHQIALSNAVLALCAQSFPMAFGGMASGGSAQAGTLASTSARPLRTRGPFGVGRILLLALGAVAVGIALDVALPAILPKGYVVIDPIVIGAPVLVATLLGIAKAASERRMLASGTRGSARIVSMNETGIKVDSGELTVLHLEVQLPGKGPYLAIHRQVVPFAFNMEMSPGDLVAVRVHPTDPALMALDWQPRRW